MTDKGSFLKRNAFQLATLALAVALFSYQLYHIFNSPVWRDDSVFGAVAKNFVNGLGYSMAIYNNTYVFHTGISAGPVITFPTILLTYLLGHHDWITKLTASLIIWIMLLSLFLLSARYYAIANKRWKFCFLALLLMLFFTEGGSLNFSIETGVPYSYWFLLIGQVQAGLMVIIAAFYVFCKPATYRSMMCAGMLFSLAILTKTLAAIGVVVCLCALMFRELYLPSTYATKLKNILCCIVALALPFALFELIKIVTLGYAEYADMMKELGLSYKIIAMSADSFAVGFWKETLYKFLSLFVTLGFPSTYALMAFVPYLAIKATRPVFTNRSALTADAVFLGLVLLTCGGAQTVWWFMFSLTGTERYLIPGLLYLAVGIALLLSSLDYSRLSKEAIVLFIIAIAIDGAGRLVSLTYSGYQNDVQRTLQLRAVNELQQLQKQGVELFSCTTNFELEYMLPGSGNFADCQELLTAHRDKKRMLVSYYIKPGIIVAVQIKGKYVATFEPLPKDILKLCDSIHMTSGRTEMRWCRTNGESSEN